MKNLFILIAVMFSLSLVGQVVPTDGRRTIKVKEKVVGEYLEEVFLSFGDAPYNYHMKKLPKKLAKYGFTNVKITALGSVNNTYRGYSLSGVKGGITVLQAGGGVMTAINTMNRKPHNYKFQVNFTSDQGEFKVRLSMFVSPMYVIKQSELVAQN